LGPNGAGKSTTLKILTGYLLPSGGKVSVAGLDVVDQSLEARRRIGYLPESTPLYTEMRVDEYLRFAARIRGVRGKLGPKIDRVVELFGLQRVIGKNILELSKGFKQRVGLAQAMVHEPDLLLLDEPTSGLDPNQIVEVRSLITRLAEEHTVVLSTHYLQEVEAGCSRIVVVDLGEIVADGTREELVSRLPGGAVRARVRGPQPSVVAQLGELIHDAEIEVLELDGEVIDYRIDVGDRPGQGIEDAIAHLVVKNGWALLEMTRERPTLEDAFRELTIGRREVAIDA
jgi:ABC-2 type transport system ATP-binding protein